MRLCRLHLGLAVAALSASAVVVPALADDSRVFVDPTGDAVIRRTDSCNCGTVLPYQGTPDVQKIIISPWQAASPSTDPYTGSTVGHNGAHLVRIDVVFTGLVNPPGTLGLNGAPYDPLQFGTNPVYGFIEIDIDNDKDTGGDQPAAAALHFLGNAARFGVRPRGPIGDRAARTADDLFQPFNQSPAVCLSGADWIISLCGCFTPTVISKSTPSQATFGAGQTWVVEGRYFQRTGAYQGASLMIGGSAPGTYDPMVRLRFQHCVSTNLTTVSLVYPLDQIGAGLLAGAPPQPMDTNVGNQTSIAEGINDIIIGAQVRPLTGLAYQVSNRWANKTVADATDTTKWRPTFIVGTAYFTPTDALYVWTDIGFDCLRGDVNGDGVVNIDDRAAVLAAIAQQDGGPNDIDGAVNGQVVLTNFGTNFSVYDINADGVIGNADLAFFTTPCPSDFDLNGSANVRDIFLFLNAWFSGLPSADFNHIDGINVQDIFDFLSAWFAGC